MKALILSSLLVFAGCGFFDDLANPVEYSTSEVRGRVVDTHQQPLEGVSISARGKATSSDQTGFFSLTGLETGLLKIRLEKPRYETQSVEMSVTLDPKDTTFVMLQIHAAPSISFTYAPDTLYSGPWIWTDRTVKLFVEINDPDTDWTFFTVDWNDGGGEDLRTPPDSQADGRFLVQNVFNDTGKFTVVVKIDEPGGFQTLAKDTLDVKRPKPPEMSGVYFVALDTLVNWTIVPIVDSFDVRFKTVSLELKAFIKQVDLFVESIDSSGAINPFMQKQPFFTYNTETDNPADSVFKLKILTDSLPAGDYQTKVVVTDNFGTQVQLKEKVFYKFF